MAKFVFHERTFWGVGGGEMDKVLIARDFLGKRKK